MCHAGAQRGGGGGGYVILVWYAVVRLTIALADLLSYQDFLALVLPDLESSTDRAKDPAKEEQVRQAAAKAIKEIRSYGFMVRQLSRL